MNLSFDSDLLKVIQEGEHNEVPEELSSTRNVIWVHEKLASTEACNTVSGLSSGGIEFGESTRSLRTSSLQKSRIDVSVVTTRIGPSIN